MAKAFPPGKLPIDVLAELLARHPRRDPRVILGPKPGEDAAVLNIGADRYLVAKTDPITFATDEIGWYAVHVNANDIATTGATPAWFMATLLLPPERATRALVEAIFKQIYSACDVLGVSLVGGHTEITPGIDRPIISGTMFGLAEGSRLITTGGAQVDDVLLVTKGVPIEATAIMAREKRDVLEGQFPAEFLERCAGYLHDPGISVVRDASVALHAGRVHAMHDPTEGGLATGLWEMADAAALRLLVNPSLAVLEEGRVLCEALGLDPLGAIASGAMLLAVHSDDAGRIAAALQDAGIPVFRIGSAEQGPADVVVVQGEPRRLPRPERDEIARLFE
mgnify:CR=1 FL=1